MPFIFCVSTGRSGTNYLAEVLGQAEDCCSVHEPAPALNGKAMSGFLRGAPALLRRRMPEKVAAIEKARGDKRFYVETNHCFIKGFGWLLPDFLPPEEMRVIVLRRSPEEVRASLSRIHCSPFFPAGDEWLITPRARPRMVPLPGGFHFPLARYWLYRFLSRTVTRPRIMQALSRGRTDMPQFVRSYEHALLDWYIAETEARWQGYRERFPMIPALEVDLADLNDPTNVMSVFNWCGMRPKVGWQQSVAKPTNLKRRPK